MIIGTVFLIIAIILLFIALYHTGMAEYHANLCIGVLETTKFQKKKKYKLFNNPWVNCDVIDEGGFDHKHFIYRKKK